MPKRLHRRFAAILLLAVSCRIAPAAPPITAAALAPDGRHVVLGSQLGVEIRSWPDLKPLNTLATELAHVHDLAFAPGGQRLLVAGGAPAEVGTVEIRTWPDAALVKSVTLHNDLVFRVAWSPDGASFATAGADAICNVIDSHTFERLISYSGHSQAVLALAFLPGGKQIVSAGVDQTLRLWDAATGEHLRTLDNHVGTVNDVAVRPAPVSESPPAVASIGEDRTLRIWQPSIGRLMRFARLPSPPRALAWTPDGQQLIVGSSDGRLRVVDWKSAAIVTDKPALSGRIHALFLDSLRGQILVAGDAPPIAAEF
jgi:WD40 repeat protein